MSLQLVKSDSIEPPVMIKLTSRQKQLILTSYKSFETNAERFSELFYARLFAVEPGTRSLFSKNSESRCGNLVKMLKIAVVSIDHLDNLVPILRLLGSGRQHNRLDYYATIGDEFLYTLENALGLGYSDEINEAWATYFGILSEMMMRRGHTETIGATSLAKH